MSRNSTLSTFRAVFSAFDIKVPSVVSIPFPWGDPFTHISTCQGVWLVDCPGGLVVRPAEVSFSNDAGCCRRVKAACPLESRLWPFICDSKAIQSHMSHINHCRDEASVAPTCLAAFKALITALILQVKLHRANGFLVVIHAKRPPLWL